MTEKKDSKLQSSQTLLWVAVFLIILGFVVISPAAGLFFQITGAFFAFIAILLGSGSTRTMAVILSIISLTLVYVSYPAYKKHMDIYLEGTQQIRAEATNSQ